MARTSWCAPRNCSKTLRVAMQHSRPRMCFVTACFRRGISQLSPSASSFARAHRILWVGNDCFPCSASVVDCTKPSQKAFKKKASFGATGGHAARGQGQFFCRESFAATFVPRPLSGAAQGLRGGVVSRGREHWCGVRAWWCRPPRPESVVVLSWACQGDEARPSSKNVFNCFRLRSNPLNAHKNRTNRF